MDDDVAGSVPERGRRRFSHCHVLCHAVSGVRTLRCLCGGPSRDRGPSASPFHGAPSPRKPGTSGRPRTAARACRARMPRMQTAIWPFPPLRLAPISHLSCHIVAPSQGTPVNVLLGFQQQLRKFVKNHRKIRKMQIQFCWVPGEETYLF
jgi:hypothetical protein